jgi:hypothetical protein
MWLYVNARKLCINHFEFLNNIKIGHRMKNDESFCPICGTELDENHFAPASFPGIDQAICCNCEENLGLMFTNFKDKPEAKDGYIVPDNSNRLEEITGRSYLENRLIFYQDVLEYRISQGKDANHDVIKQLRVEIDKIKRSI